MKSRNGKHQRSIGEMQYRRDVDGLRSIAVLPVVLFHSGIHVFSGGFVGVDVFFVISGFLITRIIADEIINNRFSFIEFYDRRVRRIFPALFFVLICTTIASVVLLLPNDLDEYSKSALATSLSISNFFFFLTTGYFEGSSAVKPLLHTWSLSVEEQFYLIMPVATLLVWRLFPKYLAHVFWGGLILSFAASTVGIFKAPSLTFYMLPTRAWELLAGAVVSLGFVPQVRANTLRQVLALLGILCILVPVFTYTESVPFPGLSALPPVLGAAIVLHCADGTLVSRVLSTKPLVYIGLLSYSLYLWHWPIIALFQYRYGLIHNFQASFLIILASLLLAVLSYRYVERPFRRKAIFKPAHVLLTGALAVSVTVAFGIYGDYSDGLRWRYTPELLSIADAENDTSPQRKECHSEPDSPVPPEASCIFGNQSGPLVAIWGDSHGVELAYALGAVAKTWGYGVAEVTSSACPPALEFTPEGRPNCSNRNKSVIDWLTENDSVETVVLVARYGSKAYDIDKLSEGLSLTIDELKNIGKRVVILGPIPTPAREVPRLLAIEGGLNSKSREFSADDNQEVESVVRALSYRSRAEFIDASDILCSEVCPLFLNHDILYFDDNHLSLTGARYLAAGVGSSLWRQ